jgi:hypothetical protein
MKPDRQHPHETPDLEAIEDRLRRLPAPRVPEGLEARLIAAFPARSALPVARAARRWRWAVAAAVAAAAAVACFMLWPRTREPDVTQRSSIPEERGPGIEPGSLAVIDPKDFDPCNILPPLPDWR